MKRGFHRRPPSNVGRERRERLSQLARCGGGCFDSRRRVNFYEAGSGQERDSGLIGSPFYSSFHEQL